MLESQARAALLLVLLALAAAPVSANSSLGEQVQEAQTEAERLQQEAERIRGEVVPPEVQDLVPEDPPSDPGPGGNGQSPTKPYEELAAQTAAEAVRIAEGAIAYVTGQIPQDPVGSLDRHLAPVRGAANEFTIILTESPPEGGADPGTASATVSEIEIPTQAIIAGATAAAAAAIALIWLAGSSGSVGAGAAGASGAGGKLAATDLRRLLPFASPLFTRFEKDTVLGHPKREALYALILQAPGVSLQSLCDSTGLSRTAVTHHLRLLELQHLIVSKRMGRSRHYYENGGRFGRDQKEALAVLQNPRSKDVASFVKDHPGAIQKALCQALGLQPSIAHWHLQRLQQALLIEAVRTGRTVSYFPGTAMKGIEQPVVPQAAMAPSVA